MSVLIQLGQNRSNSRKKMIADAFPAFPGTSKHGLRRHVIDLDRLSSHPNRGDGSGRAETSWTKLVRQYLNDLNSAGG